MLTLVMSVTTWAAEPYFEVLNGSFATKDAEVKVTFPGVTTVELKDNLSIYDGSTYLTAIFEGDYSVNGNVITFTMNPSAYYMNQPGNDPLTIKLRFLDANLSLDGVGTFYDVFSKELLPYSEVMAGSLESGDVTVKVTVPRATSVNFYPTSYPLFYSVSLFHNGSSVASLNIDSSSLSITDNTVSAVFSYAATGDKNPAHYYVYFDQYALQLDGKWNSNDVTAPFKGSSNDSDEPGGDQPGGDEPGDDEPADLTNYFWLQNLSGEASQFLIINKNMEYSTTPTVANSWVKVDNTYVNFADGEKVYLRASEEGNTNLSGHPLIIECNYKVGGDITTLLNANGNVMALPAPGDNGYGNTFGVFENFFIYDTYLQDVSELVLPSTTLAEYCYSKMFYGCDKITTAPVLPATVLVNKCYDQMFNGCSNLNYVEACFSEWPQKTGGYSPYAATENWLNGIASTGTFKTHDWVRNDYRYYSSTYPSGWEREDLSSMNITVSAVGYSTFYYNKPWVMPEGMEGYVAYDKHNNETGGNDFIFNKVFDAGEIVAWEQPLVLKANPGTYTINFTDEQPTRYISEDENMEFGGSVLTKDLSSEYNSSNYYWYALSHDENGENVGFYWMKEEGAAFTNAPFNAYLHIHKSHFQNVPVKKAFVFGDLENNVTTSINVVDTTQQTSDVIYDLSGRRVNNTNAKGIYITNGKKVVK